MSPTPSPEAILADMAIPSTSALRGQKDGVGFALDARGMAEAWRLATSAPLPEPLGPPPPPGVAGVIAPHDDYVYAGRVYRAILLLVTARTVIVPGVFHGYRKFDEHGRIVFDAHAAWRAPDGAVPVSALREALLERLPSDARIVDDTMHDSEHSIEALVYWLRHARPDLEIVPILAPAGPFERLVEVASSFAGALSAALAARGERLGEDVALAISADAIHYGADFAQTRFGAGGEVAYAQAVAFDRALLSGPLAGTVTREKARALCETFVEPGDSDTYRWTWCGRFSVPFGMLVMDELARVGSLQALAHPIAYETSLSAPPLPLEAFGMGVTAPASREHFVGYPAVGFTLR